MTRLRIVFIWNRYSSREFLALKYFIAEKYNKTVSQVVLQWSIQRNIVKIPKLVTKECIHQNSDIFDFEPTDEEMEKIKGLDLKASTVDHSDSAFLQFLCDRYKQ